MKLPFENTQHYETLGDDHLYLLVQRALIQQGLDAIESKYVTRLRNIITGQVPNGIRQFLFQLFQVYGKITPKNLWELYDAVASMSYNINKLIDVIYSSIDDLHEIAEMVGRPYTPEHLVSMGYIIIANFRSDLHW